MNIPKIIGTNSVKLLSGLANNDSSIIPMATKDTISNCAIVHTYKKEGGKDDARERAIEEFGTGAVWLFGIPAVKMLFDKTVYPLLKLDSNLDVRILKDKDSLAKTKEFLANSANAALSHEKEIIKTLDDKNSVLKSFTNSQLYKGLSVGKFAFSTAISAFALSKIIDYKQKSTQKRIEKDFYKNNASKTLLNKSLQNNDKFNAVTGKKEDKSVSFKGLGSIAQAFVYNPIVNTMLLDGVITGKRLAKARHGERKEVALKEAFQLFFIYALAKPIQMAFEAVGKHFDMPIGLDPNALFDKELPSKLANAKGTIDSMIKDDGIFSVIKDKAKENKFKFGKDKLAIGDKTANAEALIAKLRELDTKDALIDILDKNGAISTIKDKKGNIEALSTIKSIDAEKVIKTFNDIDSLSKNVSNLSKTKAFKVIAVIGNVALAAWAMGVLQPKVNIWMRKLLHNGDNRNPAIVEQERQMQMQAQAQQNAKA